MAAPPRDMESSSSSKEEVMVGVELDSAREGLMGERKWWMGGSVGERG